MENYWKVLVPDWPSLFPRSFLINSPALSFPLSLFLFFPYLHAPFRSLAGERIARTAAFAEITLFELWIFDLKSFDLRWFGEVSLLISCVDDIQRNQCIIAPISVGGGSYLIALTIRSYYEQGKTFSLGITISREINESSVKNFISTSVIKKSHGCNADEVLSSNAAAL